MKVPYMPVIGDREMEGKRDGSRTNDVPVAQFIADLRQRIASRAVGL